MNKKEYPNPQKSRKNWFDLNGTWHYFLPNNESDSKRTPDIDLFQGMIEVPYSYTFKSSLTNECHYYPVIWYAKELQIEKKLDSQYLLQFEAVDYICEIWINDRFIYKHIGGHTPFEVNVTEYLSDYNSIKIKVTDDNLVDQPLGKQKWKEENFLCWYTRTIGIWQNVWLEEVGKVYLTDFSMFPNINNASIEIDAFINQKKCTEQVKIETSIFYQGKRINSVSTLFKEGRAKYSVDVSSNCAHFRLHFWTPNDPNLYDVVHQVIYDNQVTDEVFSYFGMRNLESRNGKIYLNHQEIYQKLILNQGYYYESGLTGTIDQMEDDLMKIKEMGFNGHRIHQKIESHRMLYLCDTLGLLTWAEFPSTFEFSHQSIQQTMQEVPSFIQKHINHPSVIVYVMMNESWGVNEIAHNKREQDFVNALYYQAKAYDHTRLVIGNDGWEQTLTDISTIHDYNSNPKTLLESYVTDELTAKGSPSLTSGRHTYCEGYIATDKPFIISEYGGVAYEEQSDNDSWGYGERLTRKEDVIQKIQQLTEAVMKIDFCCGFCYTQLTDVEQEVNGLLTADRQYKFDPTVIKKIVNANRQYGFIFN